jgi:DNA ligase (NAD+)
MGKKSAANLVGEIERSRSVELWRIIYALGIRHVGEGGARALARAFGSMEALALAPVEALETVPDVGPVVARSVRGFFDEPRNRDLIARLAVAGVRMAHERAFAALSRDAPSAAAPGPVSPPAPGPLEGQLFVITGTLTSMSRDQATQAIEALGGRVSSSVSRQTTYLIVGADAGSKLEKARALGVPTLDESGFRQLIMK